MKVKFLKIFRKKYIYTFERNEYSRNYIRIFKSDFSENWCIDTIAKQNWLYGFIYNNRGDFGTLFVFTLIMFDIRISKKAKQRQLYLGRRKNKSLYEGIKNGTIKTID
jgi:hypothetical protein